MIPKKYLEFLLLALFAVFLTTCEKPARDNLWDDNSNIDPATWAPENLQIETLSITERKLTWTYTDQNIAGFKIDRRQGQENWQSAIATLTKETCQWNDTTLLPVTSFIYEYRLYAYAGNNNSNSITASTNIEFPPPSNLSITRLSDVSYKLEWQDNSTGEQGFKIDRKTGDEEWVVPFGSVGANITSFTDENVFLLKKSVYDIQYRVYAYYQNFETAKQWAEIQAELTPPTNLQITVHAANSITLNWHDNTTGEEGFMIDRKVNENPWDEGYASTAENQNTFTDNNIDLDANVYAYRVYAYVGNHHSAWVEIQLNKPTLTTASVSEISGSSAKSGGNISNDGGFTVSGRGIVWNNSPNPTLSNNAGITTDGSGTGYFTSNLNGLSPEITYFVRAWATNSIGTTYGNQRTFTTTNGLPALTTASISNITSNAAVGGGNVTNENGFPVTSRGVVWSQNPQPSLENYEGLTNNGNGQGSFTSNLTGLQHSTVYYVRAYATNSQGTSYGNQVQFTTLALLPTVTTVAITSITSNSATGGGNVTNDGGATVTARGIVWSTFQNPTISNNTGITNNGSGTGSFTSQLNGLNHNTTYFVRAYAINAAGPAYGMQDEFTTLVDHCAGVTPPPGYGVVSSSGRCWLDRNLGASRVATSSTDAEAYGDLYQWGRLTDGHEKRTSGTTLTLSSSDIPGHGNFILAPNGPFDWRSPQNPNLWQGVHGINNPCPQGYRLPTIAEWEAERQSWSGINAAGAFASPLKLPVAGYRYFSHGSLLTVGSNGYYWSAIVDDHLSMYLRFSSSGSPMMSSHTRANGCSVRCLKD